MVFRTKQEPPNQIVFIGDNLHIMRGMDSKQFKLIYLDPPFNSNADYEAPIGSSADGAVFKDTWHLTDIDLMELRLIRQDHPKLYHLIMAAGACHSNGMKSYLIMMAPRLIECRRLLEDDGSIYLHCDPTANAYLRLLMDAIFEAENFRNEIVWCYTGPGSPKMRQFNRKHDTILWYSIGETWTFNKDDVRVPYKDPKQRPRKAFDTGGAFEEEAIDAMRKRGKVPETWWTTFAIACRSKTQYTGYPTQKPEALLERIVKASSNKGDRILDPFCGCATTCVVADRLDREWVGIDMSPKAGELVNERIKKDQGALFEAVEVTDRAPYRTDLGPELNKEEKKQYKTFLWGLQEGRCNGCDLRFEKRNMDVDHIVPVKKGGTYHKPNLQLLCGNCNRVKGTKTQAEFMDIMQKRRAKTRKNTSFMDDE